MASNRSIFIGLPDSALRAYTTVGHLDRVNSESSDFVKYKWCVHYVTCTGIADNETLDNGELDRYIVLEGLQQQTVQAYLNLYCPPEMRMPDLHPDLLRIGTNTDGESLHYPPDDEEDAPGALPKGEIAEMPRFVEVGVSFNGRRALYLHEKKEKYKHAIENGIPVDIYIFDPYAGDYVKNETGIALTKEQEAQTKNNLLQATHCLTPEEKSYLASMSREKISMPDLDQNVKYNFCDLDTETVDYEWMLEASRLAEETGTKHPYVMKSEMKPLVHADGTPLDKGPDTRWNYPPPIGVYGIKPPNKVSGDEESMYSYLWKKFCDMEIYSTQDMPKAALVAEMLRNAKTNNYEQCKKSTHMSPMEKYAFGVGKKAIAQASIEEDPPTMPHTKKPPCCKTPYYEVNWIIEKMAEKVDGPGIPVSETAYNDMDRTLVHNAKKASQTIGHLRGFKYVEVLEAIARTLNTTAHNQFDGISFGPLMINEGCCGFILKGPAHPKKDTDKVSFFAAFFFQPKLLDGKVLAWWRRCQDLIRVKYNGEERWMLVIQHAWWPLKMFTLENASRVYIHVISQAINVFYGYESSKGVDDWKKAAFSPSELLLVRKMSCETILGIIAMNPGFEGFQANVRRLFHMSCCYLEGGVVATSEVANPEQKVSDSLYDNPIALYMAMCFNKFLLPRVNAKASQWIQKRQETREDRAFREDERRMEHATPELDY